jgi:hypothetical protein
VKRLLANLLAALALCLAFLAVVRAFGPPGSWPGSAVLGTRVTPQALLAGSAPAAEKHPPAVLDNAKLFSQSAAERVGHIADALRSSWGIDLCIETAREPPGIKPGSLKGKKSKEVRQDLYRAAQDRADELGVHGLYALVTLDPPSTTVVGWPADLEREWATSDHKRRQLQKALTRLPPELRDGSPGHDDEALRRRGEALVRAVEEYRKAVGDPPARHAGW